jgi:putative cardiolipin synthase
MTADQQTSVMNQGLVSVLKNPFLIWLPILLTACGQAQLQDRVVQKKSSAVASDQVEAPSAEVPKSDSTTPQVQKQATYAMRSQDGSMVANLKSEPQMLSARWDLLNKATKSVWIQTYVFRGDYVGYQIAQKLVELKKKGIDIKVIVDAEMNFDLPTQGLYSRLHQAGIDIVGFNPLYAGFIQGFVASGDLKTYIMRENNRHHEKIFIIDHEVPESARAIIGGANLSNEYFQIEKAKVGNGYWKDKDVMLKGPIVEDLANYFILSLDVHKKLNKASTPTNMNRSLSSVLQQALIKKPDFSAEVVSRFSQHVSQAPILDWLPVDIQFLVESQDLGVHSIYDEYLNLINNAKTDINIAAGYFIPDSKQIEALQNAAKRGVKITILTNSEATSDYWQVARGARMRYPKLLADERLPIEVREWGIAGKDGFSLYHSKYMCVDQTECVVGSFNFDPRSNKLNGESAVLIKSSDLATQLNQEFLNDIAPTTSTRVTKSMALEMIRSKSIQDTLMNAFINQMLPNM